MNVYYLSSEWLILLTFIIRLTEGRNQYVTDIIVDKAYNTVGSVETKTSTQACNCGKQITTTALM